MNVDVRFATRREARRRRRRDRRARHRRRPPATGSGRARVRNAPCQRAVTQIAATGAAPAATAAETGGRKVLYWHDPMVPGQKFDKPGKSPFMDMDLVPVYADAAADEGKVTISPRLSAELRRAHRGSEGRIARERLHRGRRDRRRRAQHRRRAVAQSRATSRGCTCARNTTALRPDSRSPISTCPTGSRRRRSCWRSRRVDAAGRCAARRRRAAAPCACSACRTTEIARVEREGKAVGARDGDGAASPGIVWEIGARDGMAVMPGTTIFRLAGLGTVWVIAEVPEAQAGLLVVGAPVEVRAAAFPDRVFKGSVATLAARGQRADAHGARADRARQSRWRAEARHVRERRVRGAGDGEIACSCLPRR